MGLAVGVETSRGFVVSGCHTEILSQTDLHCQSADWTAAKQGCRSVAAERPGQTKNTSLFAAIGNAAVTGEENSVGV